MYYSINKNITFYNSNTYINKQIYLYVYFTYFIYYLYLNALWKFNIFYREYMFNSILSHSLIMK